MDIEPLNVLCIDDNESDYLLIERALRTAGMLGCCERVETIEALNTALQSKRLDLVLSDYAVPGMYFTDTLRRLRHEHPNLPLILVTGTLGEVKASVMVKVGAWDYVLKNRLRRLVPAVRLAIERAATQAASCTSTLDAMPRPLPEQRRRRDDPRSALDSFDRWSVTKSSGASSE